MENTEISSKKKVLELTFLKGINTADLREQEKDASE